MNEMERDAVEHGAKNIDEIRSESSSSVRYKLKNLLKKELKKSKLPIEPAIVEISYPAERILEPRAIEQNLKSLGFVEPLDLERGLFSIKKEGEYNVLLAFEPDSIGISLYSISEDERYAKKEIMLKALSALVMLSDAYELDFHGLLLRLTKTIEMEIGGSSYGKREDREYLESTFGTLFESARQSAENYEKLRKSVEQIKTQLIPALMFTIHESRGAGAEKREELERLQESLTILHREMKKAEVEKQAQKNRILKFVQEEEMRLLKETHAEQRIEEELEELEKQAHELEEMREESKRQSAGFQQEIGIKVKKLHETKSEVEKERKKALDFDKTRIKLEADLGNWSKKLEEATGKLGELEKELAEKENLKAEIEERLKNFDTNKEQMLKSAEQRKIEIKEMESAFSARESELKEIDELKKLEEQKIKELVINKGRLAEKLEFAQKERDEVENALARQEKEFAELEEKMDEARISKENAAERNEQKRREIGDVERAQAKYEEEIANLSAKEREAEARLNGLKVELRVKEEKSAQLKEKLEAMKEETGRLNADTEELKSIEVEIQKLEKEKKSAEGRKEKTARRLVEAKKTLEQKKKLAEETERKAKEKESALGEVESEIGMVEERTEKANKTLLGRLPIIGRFFSGKASAEIKREKNGNDVSKEAMKLQEKIDAIENMYTTQIRAIEEELRGGRNENERERSEKSKENAKMLENRVRELSEEKEKLQKEHEREIGELKSMVEKLKEKARETREAEEEVKEAKTEKAESAVKKVERTGGSAFLLERDAKKTEKKESESAEMLSKESYKLEVVREKPAAYTLIAAEEERNILQKTKKMFGDKR
ncbi:MAG: hypothetical protein ABIH99_04695 [Candidatus Micrarchaeota archaeon]